MCPAGRKRIELYGRDCLQHKDMLVVMKFLDGSSSGEAAEEFKRETGASPRFLSKLLVNITSLSKQCTLPRRQFLSLGDNGRTFPSQASAEGQEDEQWQRSLLRRAIHGQPPEL
jgi:hypothetical protein